MSSHDSTGRQAADVAGRLHAGRQRHRLLGVVAPPRHRARLPHRGLLPEARPHPRRGLLRHDVLRRPAGHARHLRRVGGRRRAPGRPPGEARPQHRARPGGRRHPPHRPRRHLLDDLLLAVPRRPHVRHARPPVGRPGRLERGHVGQRRRGPELRGRRPPRPRRPLRPGRRVPRGHDRPVGHVGRRRPGARPRVRRVRRPRQGPPARPRRRVVPGPGSAHGPPVAPGPPAADAGRLVGPGPRLRGPVGRAHLHGRPQHRRRPLALQGPEGAHRPGRARRWIGQDAADGLHGHRRVGRPTPRSASSCSSTTWSTRRRR